MLTVTTDSLENHASHGDDYGCMVIRALVSGLPRIERQERVFVTVQVAIDDSGRGQEDAPAFVLAGFMATVPQWAAFADDWRDELDRPPSISLLKASEAINLKKNFAGWTEQERDARVLSFVEIIRKRTFASICSSLVKRDFDRILGHFGGALKKLYLEATMALVTRTMHFAATRKMRQAFEFIFDDEILTPNQLRDTRRAIVKRLPHAARFLGPFRHDTDARFYPLQAADLFAGYFREQLVARAKGRTFESPVLEALMKFHCIDATVSEALMNDIARGIREGHARQGP